MDRKLKMMPVVFMLIAGAITGIITYILQYEGKTALLIFVSCFAFVLCYRFFIPQDDLAV